jgi:chromate transporter
MNAKPNIDMPNNQQFWHTFLIFLRLGLTSFGGPVAHIAYFREEFVQQRKWLTEKSYADLVALCQFLPGPASSQVGFAVGLSRGGFGGGLAAWLGFTLPSIIALVLFAISLNQLDADLMNGIIHGLKIVAVAVVAQAVWSMAKNLCPDRARLTIMTITTCSVLLIPHPLIQLATIAIAGIISLFIFKTDNDSAEESLPISISHTTAKVALGLFFILLLASPLLNKTLNSEVLSLFDIFYRSGALVFGGGHVVLPLLQSELVPSGMINNDTFLAGYGAAQAVPGPLFTFASFIGASLADIPLWQGVLISSIAIFLPSFLLMIGVLPFWHQVGKNAQMRAALLGINAAVVGLLLAAFYDPIWTSAISNTNDFVLALIAFSLLMYWRCPAWLVVIMCGCAGWLLAIF